MSTVTSQNQTAPVVRQYEIGGVRYIVKATVKDGAERNRSQENPSAAPKRFEQGSHLKIKDFFISYKQTDGT